MEYIYALWHFKIGAEDEPDLDEMAQSAKDVGFYTTEEKATAAIQRLKDQPGFRDWPEGSESSGPRSTWTAGPMASSAGTTHKPMKASPNWRSGT
jgi:hypothetical protein